MEPILSVKDLSVSFNAFAGKVHAVRDVSFDLMKGETLAIVGESGSGKSVTIKAILGILAKNGHIDSGSIMYQGEDMALIFRHILPNSIGPIITRAMIAIPGAIFTESFLAYIGLGIRAPESSIGVLLSQGQKIMQQYPNQVFFPAIVISILMIAFNMLSNGLRDAFDPTQRGA